jgi:hypothetical protein
MVKIKRGDEWQHRASSPLGIVLLSEKSIVSFPFFPTHHATFAIPFLVPDDIRNRRRSALRFCRVLTNTVKRGALRWGGRIILTAHVQTFRTLTGLVFIFAGDVRGSDRVKKILAPATVNLRERPAPIFQRNCLYFKHPYRFREGDPGIFSKVLTRSLLFLESGLIDIVRAFSILARNLSSRMAKSR